MASRKVITRVALYLRVSTGEQSFAAQERELRSYCRKRGWKSIVVFSDKLSGKDGTRPGFEEMMQAARNGKVGVVVAYKLDRLGRSLSHLAMVIEEFFRLKVGMVCTSQGIDITEDNSAGRLQMHVLLAVAEFERGLIRERTKSGLNAARARGQVLGRPRSLDLRRAEVMKLRARKLGIREIARRLKMPPSSVASILSTKKRV